MTGAVNAEVEGIGLTARKPPVCREGVGTHAGVQVTEGGGRFKIEKLKISRTSRFIGGVKDHWGRRRLLPGRPIPPHPQLPSTTSSTG